MEALKDITPGRTIHESRLLEDTSKAVCCNIRGKGLGYQILNRLDKSDCKEYATKSRSVDVILR